MGVGRSSSQGDIKKVLKHLDKLESKVKEQADIIQQLDEMVDNHSETIMKILGCRCAKGWRLAIAAFSN